MCMGMCSPGPHAFLVFFQLGHFTVEDRETMKMIETTFGEDKSKYMVVLFTHGDKLRNQTFEEFVSKSCKISFRSVTVDITSSTTPTPTTQHRQLSFWRK